MKKVFALCLMLCAPLTLAAQNPRPDARRAALQGQIVQRFMDRVSTELALDAGTRGRLEQQLRESGQQRRELARASAQLRMRMLDAARDSTTSDAEFRKLLGELSKLRQREEDLWKSDQDALAKVLTPRQQTRFVFMWLRFNEQIREMAVGRPPFGGPPPR